MDKDVVHIYNGILLSHKKERNWVIFSDVDEPRVCHTEWRKSEREKQYRILTHACRVQENGTDESICRAGIENRPVDPVGEGVGTMNWATSLDIYPLPRVKQIASGKLMCRRGSSAWTELCDVLEEGDGVSGKEAQKGGFLCICIADSLHCIAEANTTL